MRFILALCIVLFSLSAQAQTPPTGTPIFLMFGASGMQGHCVPSAAPQPANGQNIWLWRGGAWVQDPQEPVFYPTLTDGCTPARYFADQYIVEGKATDVAIMICDRTGSWTDGVLTWTQAAIDTCKSQWEQAQLNGAGPVKGAFFYCCEGDYETQVEVDNFRIRFAVIANRLKRAVNNIDLPIISTVVADCTDKGSSAASLADKLQAQMHGLVTGRIGIISAEGLPWLSPGTCFHLNHVAQEEVGRRAGKLMP